MKRTYGVIALISSALLVGCQQEQPQSATPPLYVSTFEVAEPVKNQFRQFKGQVVLAEQTQIAFRRQGEVLHVLVNAGDVVKKGQLIAKLDDATARQQYNDHQAQYDLALKQYQRGKELFKREMISIAERDHLHANQKLAKAQLELAKNQLDYTRLTAPFDGTVSEVLKERYETVGVGEPIVQLYQHDKLYVQIELSDNVLTMINPDGDRIPYQPSVRFAGHPGDHKMHYLEHSSEPNPENGSYQMWLSMDQVEPPVLPGTSASIAVDMVEAGITSIDGYQVPMTTLQAGEKQGQFYVWKLEAQTATRVEVSVSQVNGYGAIVQTGISQGDQLINSNLRKLRAGKTVLATESDNG